MQKQSWQDFKNSGMLWWTNRILHTFGWSLVLEYDNTLGVIEAYPARTTHLGFSQEIDDERIKQFKHHIKNEQN